MSIAASDPSPRFAKRRAVCLALLLSLLLAGCGQPPPSADASATTDDKAQPGQKKKPPVPVEVATVQRRSMSASYSGTAALQATQEAMVVAKTSGVLLRLSAEEGDRVRAGQVLARIDPERVRLEVARHEATLRKLEAELARSKELFARKLIAADAHERIRFDVATQKAAYDLSRLELSYTDVTAPFDGVIAERLVREGNLIALNQPMFRLVDGSQLEAVLNVPERESATLRDGLPVRLAVDALPGAQFAGVIDRISPVIDAATGTFRVTARFSDGDGRLKPGMFGRIAVVYAEHDDSLAIPRQALLDEGADPAVFLVRDGVVARTAVQLGHVNGEFAEVRGGLAEGDQVVTLGKVAVREGSRVAAINRDGAPPLATPDAVAGELP
ncbi:MAG: efflux RND transporter periplasmic adaptor subunit [Lysobacteraceae bacterium]